MGIREKIVELLGGTTEEQIQNELSAMKTERIIDSLERDGLLASDEKTRTTAIKIANLTGADELDTLIRTPRPTPAQKPTLYAPAAGPSSTGDATEDAIQTEMKEKSITYSEAAESISAGASIRTGGE